MVQREPQTRRDGNGIYRGQLVGDIAAEASIIVIVAAGRAICQDGCHGDATSTSRLTSISSKACNHPSLKRNPTKPRPCAAFVHPQSQEGLENKRASAMISLAKETRPSTHTCPGSILQPWRPLRTGIRWSHRCS